MKHKIIRNFLRDLYTEAVPDAQYRIFLLNESFRLCCDYEDELHFSMIRYETKHAK